MEISSFLAQFFFASPKLPARNEKVELIVSADPKYPPLSLIAAANLLNEHGAVAATSYIHSSAREVPDNMRRLLEDFATTDSRGEADFILSLIWKNGKL